MKNYTLEEGLDSLDRIKLLMEYSLSKTASENVLLLSEQENELAMDRRLGIERRNMQALGYNPSSSSDMKKYRESLGFGGTKIDGTTISEVLSKARKFFFTPGGMTAQIVLSILGAEIGLPLVFSVLDIAILINDFSIMNKNWKSYDDATTEENWFMYHWNNTLGFKLVMEDILLLATGGFIRLAGMGAKAAYRTFVAKAGKVSKVVGEASTKLIEKTKNIKLLPKSIANWSEKKVGNISKGIDLLSIPQKAKNAIKRIPTATAIAVPNYVIMKAIENKSKEWTKYKIPDSIIGKDTDPFMVDLKKWLMEDNPGMTIKVLDVEKNKEGVYEKFIINGKTYIFDPKAPPKTYKVIPLQ
jgi:hypothetical protein